MAIFLDKIKEPADIKHLTLEELKDLSEEIRERILDVVSVNGGHLASNLGIVELTIALHKVFNSPLDKFIFDTSHQTYAHKLLTGRNSRFSSLRKTHGLSGFSDPNESDHDHFFAGHAGTGISLALGMAKNRELMAGSEHICPIIGDAALTCGLSFEALNNIPKSLQKFIVILNDNGMAIAKNVGAITKILSRMINSPSSNKFYQEMESFFSKIPSFGEFLAKQGHNITESFKNLVSTAPFFEQFGLSYVGPIPGHDLKKLIEVLEAVKDLNYPTLVHVLTVKGQGLENAISNPSIYHGATPFDKKTGEFLPKTSTQTSFPKIFGKHILEMAERDPLLVTLTPAMTVGSSLTEFMQRFPKRCLDVGIAEGHCVTFAGGLAKQKKVKVFACIYASFLQRALDNVFHDVCIQNAPVVFCLDRSGIAGGDGLTHNGIYDLGFLNCLPNLIIAQPRDGQVLKELLESAFSWNSPAVIRYPNLPTEESEDVLEKRPPGKAEILTHGKDIAILALGHLCKTALEVKDILLQEEIHATVIDPVFVKPLDIEMLYNILQTHKYIVTIEEHSLKNGFGSMINSFIMNNGFKHIHVENFGIPEVFVEHGKHDQLILELGLDAKSIARQILIQFSFNQLVKHP